MAQTLANQITIEYDTFGEANDHPLLLIMGLGTQMTRWRPGFCEQLARRGHYVIRFDNRDVGLSHKFDELGMPDIAAMMTAALAGEPVTAPYDLSDMARDAVGVLDALDVARAHVCGASMGGMIAQTMAIEHPERVSALTSIMSSTGNPDLPPSTPEAMGALLSPAGTTEEEILARAVEINGIIGSPGYPEPADEIKARALEDFNRSFYPVGVARQMAAIGASGNRKPLLGAVSVPTLVIHGEADPLVPLAGGLDTHEAIPASKLHVIEGMGHNLPEALWPQVIEEISALTQRVAT